MARIVFLIHLDRSGSTYLAKKINGFTQAGVTTEANLPDDIVNPPIRVGTPDGLDRILDRLYQDRKFQSWNLDREGLRRKLLHAQFPLTFPETLRCLLDSYFDKQDLEAHIFKEGRYSRYMDVILDQFPDSKIIFNLRDVRGTYSSQKKSRISATGELMATSPSLIASDFKLIHRFMSDTRYKSRIHVVKYEDLLADVTGELNKISDFLDVARTRIEDRNDYLENIPTDQRQLHANIGSVPLIERIESWKEELDDVEIAFLQSKNQKELQRSGYQLHETRPLGLRGKFRYSLYSLLYHYLRFKVQVKAFLVKRRLRSV